MILYLINLALSFECSFVVQYVQYSNKIHTIIDYAQVIK